MALKPEERAAIIAELNARGVDTSEFETKEDVSTDGVSVPKKDETFQGVQDYMDIPDQTERSKAVEDYLTSPEFARLVLEITGGVVGAAYAPQLSLPVLVGKLAGKVRPVLNAAVTRMAGAGIGEGAAAGVSQTFNPTFDSDDDFNEIASEILRDILIKGSIGATGEGAGLVVSKVINKVASKNKKLIKGAEEAVETIEKQKEIILNAPKGTYSAEIIEAAKSGELTPALLQSGQIIDILENVAESSIIGGGKIRYAKEGANTVAQTGIDNFIKQYKLIAGDGELGVLFQKVLTNDISAFKAAAKAKYKKVDQALSSKKFANNFQVDLSDLKKFAKEELANIGFKKQSAGVKKFLEDILAENNYITFSRANILRGDALEITRDFTTEVLGKKKSRAAAIFADKITEAMEDSPVPESVKKLLLDANDHYREGAKVFNDTLFKKIINSDPDLVYKAIIAAGDRPTLVKRTFDILDKRIKDPAEKALLKNKIRGEFLEDMLSRSQVENNQFGVEVDAGKLFKNYTQKKKTFETMFSKEERSNFNKFLNALRFAQGRKSKAGGLPGGMMIQMKQSGAILELGGLLGVGTGFTGAGATFLLGPAVIANAFTTPKIIKSLTLGFQYSDNPKLARRYVLQSLTYMAADGLISQDDLNEVKSQLKELDQEKLEKNQSSIIKDSLILDSDIGVEDQTQLAQTVNEATRFAAPLQTEGVNPNLISQAPTGVATLPSGLTASQEAYFDPDEKFMQLRKLARA